MPDTAVSRLHAQNRLMSGFFKDFDMHMVGADAVPDEVIGLHFSAPNTAAGHVSKNTFDPINYTGSQLWGFMVDLI